MPSPTSPRSRSLLVVLAALALAVAACASPEQQASPESGDFSGSDISFLQGMLPHHADGVGMAELVDERTEREELVAFAEQVRTRQQAEVAEMRELLERSGAGEGDGGGEVDDDAEDALGDDDAERTPAQRSELEALDGTPFDLTFLDRMIAHHESAIRDAQRYIDRGDHPDVLALAERIVAEQSDELEQMERWRDQWSAEDDAG
jgi:uncharacterized protein (DUF305 family)